MLGSMESTEIAAWWGAIIASIVLMWDIYKWLKQGPKVNLSLSPNMQVWEDPSRENITWVSVTVTNTGDPKYTGSDHRNILIST